MREVGSEFWAKGHSINTAKENNVEYLLSGRTALRYIIDDIFKTRKIRKVMMPSYCCESMLRPFIDLGIEIQFYHVDSDCKQYDYNNDADVILLIDFFGYIDKKNVEIARNERERGKIIIYDSTHKIDGNKYIQEYVDYSFCSYRKWFYCNFAEAIKYNGTFSREYSLTTNDNYLNIRNSAASIKEEYIFGLTTEKKEFLSKFAIAEQMLDDDYVGYLGERLDFNIHEIITKHRENALYLIKKLKESSNIKLWQEEVNADDVPMFVPILVEPCIRNDLRNRLIEEKIYCPIHWPKTPKQNIKNEMYDMELSLVCDQRYNIEDMERTIRVIENYFEKKR